MFASLMELDKAALLRVLTEPKNAFVKQYECLFKMDNVDLEFTKEALDAAADEALNMGTGARGLRSVIEKSMLKVMYDLPDLKNIGSVVLDKEVVMGEAEPQFVPKKKKTKKLFCLRTLKFDPHFC